MEYFGKHIRLNKIWRNKSLVEALCEFISSCFQGYRTPGCVTHLHSTQRGLTGEIFSSTVAQAQGFIILSLARLKQCHPVEERDGGNISEEGSAHLGLTPGPHGRDMTAFSENLWLKESEWWSYNGSRNGGSAGDALLWHSYIERDDLSLTPAGTWLTV